jgi:hypothetical protein
MYTPRTAVYSQLLLSSAADGRVVGWSTAAGMKRVFELTFGTSIFASAAVDASAEAEARLPAGLSSPPHSFVQSTALGVRRVRWIGRMEQGEGGGRAGEGSARRRRRRRAGPGMGVSYVDDRLAFRRGR